MSQRGPIQAAGAVVLRTGPDGRRLVLAVHRPRYDDLTLPKGKIESGEVLAHTAVREVGEETGLRVRLGASLQPIEYSVPRQGPKVVRWWVGHEVDGTPDEPDGQSTDARDTGGEVDAVVWVPVDAAPDRLSHGTEVQVLEEALALPTTATVILARHAKAMSRKDWVSRGNGAADALRPLDRRGRRQARELAQLLDAYGVRRLVSSTSTRCLETLEPYADLTGLEVESREEFSEESHSLDPRSTARAMDRIIGEAIVDPSGPVAICGHRPVLPLMRDLLTAGKHPMSTAECLVVHLDERGVAVRQEWVVSPV
ncbi:NUDIX hydrolase [Acidipropionibacterium timonense]|uniref:NUDIX hydrolase n=1 Tax=Acidipropionibacterium timonense TaxID=2161818 RepID=UPI00103267AC|nr:NUDIX hydrolase [Acidipropionibacterium timonense]